MTITSIYEPIQDDLVKVEESIKAFCHANDYPWMADFLAYILEDGGKRVRPAVVLLAAKFHTYDLEKLIPLATAIEVFHNATLVHDDSVDKASVRRGKPSAVSVWGDSVALLLGDYLFGSSADLMCRTGSLEVMRLFARTIMTICSGQLKELMGAYNWRRGQTEYYEEIESKTAALFATAAQSGAILSEASRDEVEALKTYGHAVGMAFQIIDDILDFIGDEKDLGKPVGGDLLQGTVTLPAILFAEKYPEDSALRGALENRDDRAQVQQFVDRLRDSSVIQECYGIAAGFTAQARRAIEMLPDIPAHRSLVGLTDYIIERRK